MRTFVMGDIHGADKALTQCLERSGFDYDNDLLIQLGDVVDRYPEAYECVETLLSIKNLIAIKGNHDDWFATYLDTASHPFNWAHGGEWTSYSYGLALTQEFGGSDLSSSPEINLILPSHLTFFRNQLFYFIDSENRCFVHAGFDVTQPFFTQSSRNYFWDRNLWMQAMEFEEKNIKSDSFSTHAIFKEIYIGHSSTLRWKTDRPMCAANIWNLDTGAGFYGKLTIMDVASKEYWQSDNVPKLYCDQSSFLYRK